MTRHSANKILKLEESKNSNKTYQTSLKWIKIFQFYKVNPKFESFLVSLVNGFLILKNECNLNQIK